MKALLFAVIIALAAISVSDAQLAIMPKVGATLSEVAFSEDIQNAMDADFWPKLGFVGGAAFEIPLSDAFALQPELLWVQKGFYYEYEDPLYSESYNITLNYLEVPVMLEASIGRFYFAAGPSIAYGISGRYNGKYEEDEQEFKDEGKVKFGKKPDGYQGDDQYIDNAFDFGVQFGLGVETSALVIDVRYGVGLLNMFDKGRQFEGDVRSRNRCLQLTVGYSFMRKD